MKKNLLKTTAVIMFAALVSKSGIAQGTLEFTEQGSSKTVTGPTTNPVVVAFWSDASNPAPGTTVPMAANQLTATFSIRNQNYSTTLTGSSTVVPGMTFGGRLTGSTGGNNQAIGSTNLYAPMGAGFGTTGAAQPLNSMFTTSPTATPATRTNNLGAATAVAAEGFDGIYDGIYQYNNPSAGGLVPDANHAVACFNTVEPLHDLGAVAAPANGRYLYGQLVITFNRPVKNPVIHIGGLGGSYAFTPTGPNPVNQISYFCTELEMVNQGYTSTFMAGNEFFNVSGNNILNSAVNPNGGSFFKPSNVQGGTTLGFDNYGAASGSVRVNGTVTELVYNVFIRGGANSTLNFSANQNQISNATRDPFNGDLYYVSISLDKPTQQLSGNVFIDADGLNDAGGGDINRTAGVANPKTNVGNTLYANLIDAQPGSPTFGNVIATQPINADGTYLFDNIAVGSYRVQLTTIPGTAGQNPPATNLPATWVNTGEFVGNTAGSDGLANGNSIVVPVNAEDARVEVNFGIQRIPESVSFDKPIPFPALNSVITLNNTALALPILSGSDVEDQPTSGVLNGKTLRITAIPTNTTLRYNGVAVTANTVITNFNPNNLSILFNQPIDGSVPGFTSFQYAYIDRAGAQDPTPATYTVRWPEQVLPLTINSFNVEASSCTAKLAWVTSSEINVEKFEVEVSVNNAQQFKAIGTIAATGNGNAGLNNYNFSYAMKAGEVYYFRVKAIDFGGPYTVTRVEKASCSGKGLITMVPNPVRDVFTIRGMGAGKNSISIFSKDGKLVKTEVSTLISKQVDIANLPAAVYIVRVINENGTVHTEQIIKQ
jgi:hypothetical protein